MDFTYFFINVGWEAQTFQWHCFFQVDVHIHPLGHIFQHQLATNEGEA